MAKQCISSKDDVNEKKHDLKEKLGKLKEKKDKLKEEEDELKEEEEELKEEEDDLNEMIDDITEKEDDINKNIGDINDNTSSTGEQTGDIKGNKDEVKMPVQETGDVGVQKRGEDVLNNKLTEDLPDHSGMEYATDVKFLNRNPVMEEKGNNLHLESSLEQGSIGRCEATGISDCIHDPGEFELTGMEVFGEKIHGTQNFKEALLSGFLEKNPSAQVNGIDLYTDTGTSDTDEKVGQGRDYADHSTTDGILHTNTVGVCHGVQDKRDLLCPENLSAKKTNIQPAAGNGILGELVKRTGKHKRLRKKKEESKEAKGLRDLKLPPLHEIMVLLIGCTFSALISVRSSCWLRFTIILLSIYATSSSSCSFCQIYEFCTGENLLNQPLTISIAGKENFCRFQFTAHSVTDKCNKSEVTLNKTQMCVLLSVTGQTHDNLCLEYGIGRTTPIPAVLAGCCDKSPTGSREADFSIQISAPPQTHNTTGIAGKDPGQIAAIIVPSILVGICLIVFVACIIKRKRSKQGVSEHVECQTPPEVVIEMGRCGVTNPTGGSDVPQHHQSNGEIASVKHREKLPTDGGAVSMENYPAQDHSEENGDALSPVGITSEEHPEMNLGTTSSSPQDGEIESRDDDALTPNMGARKSHENNIY